MSNFQIKHPTIADLTCGATDIDVSKHDNWCYGVKSDEGMAIVKSAEESLKADLTDEEQQAILLKTADDLRRLAIQTASKRDEAQRQAKVAATQVTLLNAGVSAYEKQIESVTKEIVVRKAAEARQKAKEARDAAAYERLKKQLEGKDVATIAAALVERGVQRIEDDPMSALEVLRQAGDILAATYWVSGAEFKGTSRNTSPDFQDFGYSKYIPVKIDGDVDGQNYRAITGVCSIGALALARVKMSEGTEHEMTLATFDNVAQYDFATFAAGAALARQICDSGNENTGAPSNVIASWNDALPHDTDEELDSSRRVVIETFRAAEKSPLLFTDEIWAVQYLPGYLFEDAEAAQAALADPNSVPSQLRKQYTSAPFDPNLHLEIVRKNEVLVGVTPTFVDPAPDED